MGCVCCKSIREEITIDASAETVWKIMANFEEYSQWNSFLIKSSVIGGGEAKVGAFLQNSMLPPGNTKPMSFTPRILAFTPNQELRWLGSLGCRGIFDGEHYFLLESLSSTQTRLIQGEEFCGCLVGMCCCCINALLLDSTRLGFQKWNKDLKQRAEQLQKSSGGASSDPRV